MVSMANISMYSLDNLTRDMLNNGTYKYVQLR